MHYGKRERVATGYESVVDRTSLKGTELLSVSKFISYVPYKKWCLPYKDSLSPYKETSQVKHAIV